jgi:ankyrin repeat protein
MLGIMSTPPVLMAQPDSARPARIDSELVRDFVGKAHQRDLAPMKEMLQREPGLLQASWDWGAGDWETALQAAAHTGSREMALFLLDRGARLDLFAASMLGELTVLKTAVETFPPSLQVRGAHGIPLLSHAVAGAKPARKVMDYLLERAVDVNARHNNGMSALMIAVQTGQRDAVQLLLSKGADAKAKAQNGQSVLTLSLKRGQPEITNDLKQAGATE